MPGDMLLRFSGRTSRRRHSRRRQPVEFHLIWGRRTGQQGQRWSIYKARRAKCLEDVHVHVGSQPCYPALQLGGLGALYASQRGPGRLNSPNGLFHEGLRMGCSGTLSYFNLSENEFLLPSKPW